MAGTQVHAGRVGIVTGGASGIGRSTALLLASQGAKVCVADLDLEAAEGVAKEIAAAGGDAFAHPLDVASPEQNDAAVEAAVARFGALHLAYLNAGVARQSSVLGGDIDIWDRVVAINLSGVYYGMHSAAKAIVAAGGGAIVATASIAGMTGGRGMPSYFATKHGVIGLVRAGAAELTRHGVRVNAVCPGVIDTPILGANHGKPEIADDVLGQGHLFGRCGRPEEVARVVSFLLSDDAGFVTAAAWPVDGGLTGAPGGPGSEEADAFMEQIQGEFSAGSKAF